MQPRKQTQVISIENSYYAILEAQKMLDSGGLIAFPTDTIYGLAAPCHSTQGIEHLYQVKGRDTSKAIAILIGSIEQLATVALELNDYARKLINRLWPGALTIVVPRHPGLPENLSPLPTIGVRMPDYRFTLDLLLQCGPLATTSANLTGGLNPLTCQDVLSQLKGKIDLVIDGGPTPGGQPSTVVDCTKPEPVILRQGAISAEIISGLANVS